MFIRLSMSAETVVLCPPSPPVISFANLPGSLSALSISLKNQLLIPSGCVSPFAFNQPILTPDHLLPYPLWACFALMFLVLFSEWLLTLVSFLPHMSVLFAYLPLRLTLAIPVSDGTAFSLLFTSEYCGPSLPLPFSFMGHIKVYSN